jgi:hypothetical protein
VCPVPSPYDSRQRFRTVAVGGVTGQARKSAATERAFREMLI